MLHLKKIYSWVLSFSEKPSGPKILSFVSFIEAIFFPVPPDVLLIPLAIGNRKKSIIFGLLCSVFSVLGASLGYFIGSWVWWNSPGEFSTIANYFFDFVPGFTHSSFDSIKNLYEEYNFLIIFTAGFTPIPFKLFTISAGSFKINFFLFIFASTISRSTRFLLIAFLIKVYGESIRHFIERYFNLLALLFIVILIAGFVVIKFYL